MSDKESAQNVIETYRKRQKASQRMPTVILLLAALLLIAGAAVIIFSLIGEKPLTSLLGPKPTETATTTVTATATRTATATSTITQTPTDLPPTDTPTATHTPTPASAFIYVVQSGDNLTFIAETFNVSDPCLIIELNANLLDRQNPIIYAGQQLVIPPPGLVSPTATPIPPEYRGVIEYMIAPGEGLYSIAAQFNSTVDAILKENDLTAEDVLQACQLIKIPVNIATPVATFTPLPAGGTPGAIMTLTPEPTQTATSQP